MALTETQARALYDPWAAKHTAAGSSVSPFDFTYKAHVGGAKTIFDPEYQRNGQIIFNDPASAEKDNIAQQSTANQAAQVTPGGGASPGGAAATGGSGGLDASALAGLQSMDVSGQVNSLAMSDQLGQGLGTRRPPQSDNILAQLRRIY
jgi:hypothetical protein